MVGVIGCLSTRALALQSLRLVHDDSDMPTGNKPVARVYAQLFGVLERRLEVGLPPLEKVVISYCDKRLLQKVPAAIANAVDYD